MKNQNTSKKVSFTFKECFKDDLLAGFSVSLIALPLCLGIAIASGVPPLAGLIAAIVGGLFASRVSGTFVTISGPAAGLIVITLGAAEAMGGAGAATGFGGYPHVLGAIVVGGLIMALLGFLKVGKVGDYFPSAAVHGMLAAIGVIIIIKQFFPAIGASSPKGEILEVATEIPHALMHDMNPYALGIGVLTLVILIIHPMLKIKLIRMIPAPMWVLICTIPTAIILGTEHLDMVVMPHNLFGEGGFKLPSFEKIGESAFWIAVTGFALVSAIESLLSAKAVDSIDPYKRSSNLDNDLISMGVGSSLSAAIGGLPIISEIVRSSANVNNGAKTQWANFFHGAFLLIYLLIGVFVIEMIPIAALAAMLVFTGFKLASPKEFKHMLQIGTMELQVFIVTLVAVLATDLIIGIVSGILFKYVLLLSKGVSFKELFTSKANVEIKDGVQIIHLKGSQIFSNYLSLKKKLDHGVEEFTEVLLDFTEVQYVDHTVMEHLEDYERLSKMNGKEVHIINSDVLHPVSSHPLAARDRDFKDTLKNTKIGSRTLELFSFADINGHQFKSKSLNYGNWDFYELTIRKKLIVVKNVIHFVERDIHYKIADVETKSGARMAESFNKETVIRIVGLKEVPRFYMHKTDLVEIVKESFGKEDISFDSHPKFSAKYSLNSDSMETEVRAFFNDDLLDLFETYSDVFFSGNGKDLLFHFKGGLANTTEIKHLIRVAKQIVKCVDVVYK